MELVTSNVSGGTMSGSSDCGCGCDGSGGCGDKSPKKGRARRRGRGRVLDHRSPRPSFRGFVNEGPTYAIPWAGDDVTCGCGCAECDEAKTGCGCNDKPGGHMNVIAPGWAEALGSSTPSPGGIVGAGGGQRRGGYDGFMGPSWWGPLEEPGLWATPYGGGFVSPFPGTHILPPTNDPCVDPSIPPWDKPWCWYEDAVLCPPRTDPLDLPAFTSLDVFTRICFTLEHGEGGLMLDWPQHQCCPPEGEELACGLPDPAVVDEIDFYVRDFDPSEWGNVPQSLPAGYDTSDIEALYRSALALVLENLDLVQWLACLINAFSPDLNFDLWTCMNRYLSGSLPFHVTFVSLFTGNPGATGAAFTRRESLISDGTEGIKIPVENPQWQALLWGFQNTPTTEQQLCAVAHAASIIVHELVHVCADHRGGGHEDDSLPLTCWDEQRMMGYGFRWAIAQRFPCIQDVPCCSGPFQDSRWFMHSVGDALADYVESSWSCEL